MAVLEITNANFQEEVIESEVPVLVDFWATWCGPCKVMGPVIDEVAASADGFKVGKVNVDDEMELARRFRVMSIPTLIVFEGGEAVKRSTGAIQKDEVLALLNK